jgi:hypothetical protein
MVLEHTKKRVAAVLKAVERIKQSEFPYSHSRIAAELIETKFKKLQSIIEKVSAGTPHNLVLNTCRTAFEQLFTYVPFLGFILRSTNVRNAFEVYPPLLRLAKSMLGTDTKLVVSSEWDYSPYVYPLIQDLPGFVLIGLPAPESANPLLLPLAGHELGHSVWVSQTFSAKYEKQIQDLVLQEITEKRWKDYKDLYPGFTKYHYLNNDIVARPIWLTVYTWTLLQTEEIFCDFFGIRLFSESYLHAFEYLLSPGFAGIRSVRYPNIARRVLYLTAAAKDMGTEVSPNFKESFIAESEPQEPTTNLLVSTADAVSVTLIPELIELTQEFAKSQNVPLRDVKKVAEIREGLNKVIPTAKACSLTDILNAGWACYLDPDLWKNVTQIENEDRDRVLKDLILKSLEVTEAYERLR